jgi:hypothetical protein
MNECNAFSDFEMDHANLVPRVLVGTWTTLVKEKGIKKYANGLDNVQRVM